MKTTGKQWNEFIGSAKYWPADGSTYTEDDLVKANGIDINGEDFIGKEVGDCDTIEIVDGYIMWPSVGPDEQTLAQYFRRWEREQNTVTFIVTCDKSQESAVRLAIKAGGGKIG